jgi:hypothetical protein
MGNIVKKNWRCYENEMGNVVRNAGCCEDGTRITLRNELTGEQ